MVSYSIEKIMMPDEKLEGYSNHSCYAIYNSNGRQALYFGAFAWTDRRILFVSEYELLSDTFIDAHYLTEIESVSRYLEIRFAGSDEYIVLAVGRLSNPLLLSFFENTVKCECTYHVRKDGSVIDYNKKR